MKIYYLGLFDWKNQHLDLSKVKRVAGIFLADAESEDAADGWYRCGNIDGFDGVSVTHSRIIFELSNDKNVEKFSEIRAILEESKSRVEKYLEQRMKELNGSELGGLISSCPFIFLYPIVQLEVSNKLYWNEFKKQKNSDWHIPADLSTSCFFAIIDDRSAGLSFPKEVYMRISGSSLIMGRASNRFAHRVINMLYYAGLYEMTRISNTLNCSKAIYFGLEPLLEKQGEEICNVLLQRTEEENVASINQRSLWLSVIATLIALLSLCVSLFWRH